MPSLSGLKTIGKKKLIIILSVIFVLIAIPITVYLALQRQETRKKAAVTGDGRLVCNSGPQAYGGASSTATITVTNNTNQTLDNLTPYVFRCAYTPNRIKSGYKCQYDCSNQEAGADCQVGVWDNLAVADFVLAPGESRTLTATANPCEILQLDVQNADDHVNDDPTECYNIGTSDAYPAPPNPWNGGIAFSIKENSSGYNPATGTCPTPSPTNTPTSTPAPTTPPEITQTPTPTPTTPEGVPTSTPTPTTPLIVAIPTNTPVPTSTPAPTVPAGSTPTPTTAPPVSGTTLPTLVTVAVGVIIVVLGLAF